MQSSLKPQAGPESMPKHYRIVKEIIQKKQRTTRNMETARYQRKKHLPSNLNEKRKAEIEATMETYKQY